MEPQVEILSKSGKLSTDVLQYKILSKSGELSTDLRTVFFNGKQLFPRTERPDQTLALMPVLVSGQTRLMNSIWRGCEVGWIWSLGDISANVKGAHEYDGAKEPQ